MNGSALDRYITGNYGEDQFREPPKYSRAWQAGQKARVDGKPITSCRCRSEQTRREWKSGWSEEDLALRIEEREDDGE